MISLEPSAIHRILAGEPISHGSTALRHALAHQRPGLWSDDPVRPSSLAWLRVGDEGWEAFASGESEPALDWIQSKVEGRTVALLAPESWRDAVQGRGGVFEMGTIQTFTKFDLMVLRRFSTDSRVLRDEDAPAFEAIAPSWALRSWGDFRSLTERGLALGLFSAEALVSTAWTYESDLSHDKIGVATVPRLQGLGLGKRVALALLNRIINDRKKAPLWVTSAENTASLALARAIGFSNPIAETLLRWTPA